MVIKFEMPRPDHSTNDQGGNPDMENKENQIENKTLGPIYMVLRENNNWDKYAPKIIEHIKQLGGEIETMSFPRDTDKEEIKKWYEENQDRFQGKFLLTDTTCEPQIEKEKFQSEFNLDKFLQDSNRDLIYKIIKDTFGENLGYPEPNQGIEGFKDTYTKMFKLALERNLPKKVTFLMNKASHHFNLPSNEMEKRSKEYDEAVANFFKECLLEAGYLETNISMVNDIEIKPEEIELMKNEWFMIDSHCHDILKKFEETGLDHFEPGDIRKLIVPGETDQIDNRLLLEVDRNFKKIESPEEFFVLNPDVRPVDSLIDRIGGEEKLVEIMNYAIDFFKKNENENNHMIEKIAPILLFNIDILKKEDKKNLQDKVMEIRKIQEERDPKN